MKGTLEFELIDFPFDILEIFVVGVGIIVVFDVVGSIDLVVVCLVPRLEELEVAPDEFPVQHFVKQITHVLSVTLPLIKNYLHR